MATIQRVINETEAYIGPQHASNLTSHKTRAGHRNSHLPPLAARPLKNSYGLPIYPVIRRSTVASFA